MPEIKEFYIIIVSEDSQEFQEYLKSLENRLEYKSINFAIQDFYGQVKTI